MKILAKCYKEDYDEEDDDDEPKHEEESLSFKKTDMITGRESRFNPLNKYNLSNRELDQIFNSWCY